MNSLSGSNLPVPSSDGSPKPMVWVVESGVLRCQDQTFVLKPAGGKAISPQHLAKVCKRLNQDPIASATLLGHSVKDCTIGSVCFVRQKSVSTLSDKTASVAASKIGVLKATKITECRDALLAATSEADVYSLLKKGVDKKMILDVAAEIAQDFILNPKLSDEQAKKMIANIAKIIRPAGGNYGPKELLKMAEIFMFQRKNIQKVLSSKNSRADVLYALEESAKRVKDIPLMAKVIGDALEAGYQTHFRVAIAQFSEQLNLLARSAGSPNKMVKEFKDLQLLSKLANVPIADSLLKSFSDTVVLPLFQSKASSLLVKVSTGEVTELSFEELEKITFELDSFEPQMLPSQISISELAAQVLEYVDSHLGEVESDPTIATRAHQIVHNLAQKEICEGNIKNAFAIEKMAAEAIVLSDLHPLIQMDKAILEASSKQHNPHTGAFFGSFDTSVVKGGHLHASQRIIDGKLTNSFDFKISHYARDELTEYLKAIMSNPDDFMASLPAGLCTGIGIREGVPHQFHRYVESEKEFTRVGGYTPGNSVATEIMFAGAGKIIIGDSKENGTMYNWVQVEMDANLPSGDGARKLQQILAITGLGPVLGQQPKEADERMKIAQIFRAFYPYKATAFDTTKRFYQLSIEDLRREIVTKAPGMEAVFKKYLEEEPDLMQKVEILPGKEIWGITDLGQQLKQKGAWGFMTGVGNSGGWQSGKKAIERLLTQGAMSSEQRFQAGAFKEGASSEADLLSGGGDQVFARMINYALGGVAINNFTYSGSAQILWNIDTVAQRVPYCYDSDKYGVRGRFSKDPSGYQGYDEYQDRPTLFNLAESLTHTTRNNEVMIKNSLDAGHIAGVVVNDQKNKDDLIQHLAAVGLLAEGGDKISYVKVKDKEVPVDEFIYVGRKFKQEWWS